MQVQQGTYEEIDESIPEENKLELRFRKEVEGVECDEITEEEAAEYIPIAQAMIEFTINNGGMGLSAPQVGINKRLIVWMGKDNTFHIGFNPTFFKKEKKFINTVEGCLSYPDEEYFIEKRHKYIQAVYYAVSQTGKLIKVARAMRPDESIVYQHEVDHINGITIAMRGKKIATEQNKETD